MSAHKVPFDLFNELEAKDPGASGTIKVDRSPLVIGLISATAESRTLPRPTKTGTMVLLYVRTSGGTITLTVTGGYNLDNDTSLSLTAVGQFVTFESVYDGTNFRWMKTADHNLSRLSLTVTDILDGLTSTAAELNTLHSQTLTTGAGAGVTGGAGAIYKTRVQLSGGIYITQILIDLTDLQSSTTDLDIIGQSTTPAHFGQITAAQNGTIFAGTMQCLEVPVTGVTDIDVYWATEATGKFDDAVTGLTETVLLTNGGAWTLALTKAFADPVGIANGYLYVCNGAAGTVGTYTAGKFLITLYGI